MDDVLSGFFLWITLPNHPLSNPEIISYDYNRQSHVIASQASNGIRKHLIFLHIEMLIWEANLYLYFTGFVNQGIQSFSKNFIQMAVSRLFSEVTIGGDASDNPSGYSWTTYVNYPHLDLNKSYQRIDVITNQENLQVTGLALIIDGHVRTGPNDLCFLPCPPFC